MDANVIGALFGSIASNPSLEGITLDLTLDGEGAILPVTDEIIVRDNDDKTHTVKLQPLRELFTGNAAAPDLARGPTPKLEPFFLLVEDTVLRFCDGAGRNETDQEMERIYALLRRRPDSRDSPLHSYLRAAARLYLSLRDVSQAEYEAVMGRLAKSARTFSEAPISRNYLKTLFHSIPG